MAVTMEQHGGDRANIRLHLLESVHLWEGLGLVAILALSACLNLLWLGREGYGNSYYAAAVRSMLQSWHNFFFVSFDPGGFVTVDKPPLGYWIQTASAKLFGFHGWSLLLPQALAGVLSVGVLFLLVRRSFGPVAGLLAALALAITPVAIADNRNNTVDSLLVLTLLLAAWTVFRATESGRLRWLLLGMFLVGLGFNIKMLQAYLVLPAFYLFYVLAAPCRLPVRIVHLALASVALVAVSLSWAVAVDLTPASARPYVGSSQHNSELELAFGYNGLQRIVGMRFPGSGPRPSAVSRTPSAASGQEGSAVAGAAGQVGAQRSAGFPAAGTTSNASLSAAGTLQSGNPSSAGSPGAGTAPNNAGSPPAGVSQPGGPPSAGFPAPPAGFPAAGAPPNGASLPPAGAFPPSGAPPAGFPAPPAGFSPAGAPANTASLPAAGAAQPASAPMAEPTATSEGSTLASVPFDGVAQQGIPPTGAPSADGAPDGTEFPAPPSGGFPGGGGGPFMNGAAGLQRLFNQFLGGQASWLIPLAVFGVLAAWQTGFRRRPGRPEQSALVWGGWLLTGAVFFSIANFFHPYYLIMLAPAVSALAGIATVELWRAYRQRTWRGWLLPLALLSTAATQVYILHYYPGWRSWLDPLIVGVCLLAAVVLVLGRMSRRLRLPALALGGALALGIAGVLIAPAIWSGYTTAQGLEGGMPSGGPQVSAFGFPGGPTPPGLPEGGPGDAALGRRGANPPMPFGMGDQQVDTTLLNYLEANRGSSRFLVAMSSSMQASPIIIQTGEPVMAMGGFTGSDPILTAGKLAQDVANGTVRFILLDGRSGPNSLPNQNPEAGVSTSDAMQGPPQGVPFGGPPGFGGSQGAVQTWVTTNCAPVPASAYGPSTSSASRFGFGLGGSQQLYECATATTSQAGHQS